MRVAMTYRRLCRPRFGYSSLDPRGTFLAKLRDQRSSFHTIVWWPPWNLTRDARWNQNLLIPSRVACQITYKILIACAIISRATEQAHQPKARACSRDVCSEPFPELLVRS
uniref:Uncharacterized protein n=1 Tax=Anopheles atroparvus TaxID=41427 RepID=A0AAG5CNW1_ANOAO